MKRQHSTSEQPSPDDFADLFENIFASETDIHDPLVHACEQPFDENLVDDSVPLFQFAELQLACSNSGKVQSHQCLLDIYNKMLAKNEYLP